nr:DnaJ domain-containing protein [uncultured Rhodopila sp.]
MLWLILGAVVLFVLMGGARAFERASVTTIKSFLAWVAALGGIVLALLLILTGRGGIALGPLVMFGPLLYRKWQESRAKAIGGGGGASARPPPNRPGAMTRKEAYEVLGLHPGASEADIRDAHRRLMRGAHPDAGGSDWLASRVNQARDILLG